MDEQNLRYFLSQLNITITHTSNQYLNAHCPLAPWFHQKGQDYRPSFGAAVSQTDFSHYHCFSCHKNGSIAALARLLGELRHGSQFYYSHLINQIEAVERQSYVVNFDEVPQQDLPPEPLIEEIYEGIFEKPIVHPDAIKYLTSRNISLKIADKLGLRFDDKERRILFDIRDCNHNLMGFSGRSIDGKDPKIRDYYGLRKKYCILGVDRWKWDDYKPLILVEGLFGFLWLHELNVEKIADIGCLLGSSLSKHQRQIISNRNTTTILLLDPDQAGQEGAADAARKLRGEGFNIFIPKWPWFGSNFDVNSLNKRQLWNMIKDYI